jgi:N,N'-diacetyllegionaminate synthase
MSKVIIIAEAGVNHNGDIQKAFQLVDIAADAGVDFVKFQTFKSENLVSSIAKKANYQIENTRDSEESQLEMLKKLELNEKQHDELIAYCKLKKIDFFSTAFDLDSLEYLAKIGLKIVKIPSGEITNLPYLKRAAELFSSVIISTGMSTMQEIQDALNIFLSSGFRKSNITILHCNTEYPTPMEDVNLLAMLHIKNEFQVDIGYSDHTLGIEIPIAAVALGAKVIEKHFTIDKNMKGPDHAASLSPSELKKMVEAIRNIEKAIAGSGLKEVSHSERKNILIARKSIFAKKDIHAGDYFTEENITTKRPGNGISAMIWDKVIGQKASRYFATDEMIEL